MKDLRSYFKQVKYYWIIGKMGEIEIDSTILSNQQTKWIIIIDFINKTLSFAERLLSIVERIKKLITLKK